MRFNKEDLRKGNVSKERIQEVVLRSVLKIDPTLHNEEEVLRNAPKLISDVDKVFLFKPAHIPSEEESREIVILENRMKELSFFTKLSLANQLILDQERLISYTTKENRKKEFVLALGRLESLRTTALIQEQNHIAQIRKIENDRQALLAAEAYLAQKHLNELKGYRDDLKKANIEHNKNIKAARIHYSNEIMKHLDDVNVDGVSTFEGMSTEQKRAFVDDWMAVIEIENRKKAWFAHEKEKERALIKIEERNSPQPTNMMFGFQNHKASNTGNKRLAWLESEEQKMLHDSHLAKIRVAHQHNVPHINNRVSIDECNRHLQAFENQHNIKANRKMFSRTVQHEQRQIFRNNDRIAIADQTIASVNQKKEVKVRKKENTSKEKNETRKTKEEKIKKENSLQEKNIISKDVVDITRQSKQKEEIKTDILQGKTATIEAQELTTQEGYESTNLEDQSLGFVNLDDPNFDIPVSFDDIDLAEFSDDLNMDDFPNLDNIEFDQIGKSFSNDRPEFRSDLKVR